MYVVSDRKRFRAVVRGVRNTVLLMIAVVWFCTFIYSHSGLGAGRSSKDESSEYVKEFVTYEEVVKASHRKKEVVPVKVIYRYVEQEG